MMRLNLCGTWALALVLLFAIASRAQLSLDVHVGTLETFISNHTGLVISLDGYQVTSATGILDPVNWKSITDSVAANPAAVSAALGSGALSFIEFAPTATVLTELNPAFAGTWQPGTLWSIGFPFGNSLSQFQSRPFDGVFQYTGATGGVVTGPITFVPEPSTPVIAATALVGLALSRRRTLRG